MKHFLTLALFLFFSIGFAQDFKEEWKEVIQFELDGKTKSAQEVVDKIYKQAKKKKIEDQIIKCFFYQSKFIKVRNENAQSIILDNLNREISDSKGNQKALLKYIYATILQRYYDSNRYVINNRTKLKEGNSEDWKTWTSDEIEKKIEIVYQDLLKDERKLRETNLREFASILEISPYTDSKKLSLYDFLLDKTIDYHFLRFNNFNSVETNPKLFTSPAEFIKIKTDTISNQNLKTIVELYQNNEKYCLQKKNLDIDLLQYARMKRLSAYYKDKPYYFSKLSELEQSTSNNYLLQDIRVDKANYYYSITIKGTSKNYYPEALSLIESVLNSTENPNAKVEAETIKEKILSKEIALTIPKRLYPNQNYRAFVEHKNIDTISVSYYKIPVAFFKQLEIRQYYYYNNPKNNKAIDRDSLVFDYIQKHKPIKITTKVLLPKTDHFDYTSEIVMDNMEIGSYLLFFDVKNPLGYDDKKAYAYHTLQVSNMDYLEEIENDGNSFQVLNRKTGQPIENVTITNDVESQKSNKAGKAMLKGDLNYNNYYTDLIFAKDNDTLCGSYFKYRKGDEIVKDEFQAKAMVFFDRAIYRPGQKVYFKGFMLKNKDKIKSVVPFVTVHVIITDADENEVKDFDIQTNEFGSFHGEYEIPKNILTGEFHITIEEPDDYEADTKYYDKKEEEHTFWDYVKYNDNTEFKFKVEEYKRPTFEITFDQIKENYTIDDTVIIRGNAKTLAGSNLTNAKVSYAISKIVRAKNTYYRNISNYINKETTTDDKGNFKIEFAAYDSIAKNQVESFDFKINVAVTDINGETRNAETSAVVAQKMLELNCKINPNIYQEDPKSLVISATTLNHFPLKTKGTISFVEQNKNEYLLKKDRFPQLQNIDKKEYQALFPYEAYDENDIKLQENKVLSLPFDTEKSGTVDLAFLKKFKLGNYKIILEATDQKGNLITHEAFFELEC